MIKRATLKGFGIADRKRQRELVAKDSAVVSEVATAADVCLLHALHVPQLGKQQRITSVIDPQDDVRQLQCKHAALAYKGDRSASSQLTGYGWV